MPFAYYLRDRSTMASEGSCNKISSSTSKDKQIDKETPENNIKNIVMRILKRCQQTKKNIENGEGDTRRY
ncbi:hypothetical protein GJ496_005012 [Pomphorhynchus laevis]|nr:hypothetical protein GJ496_005012 [Pomphorhynchus laevis]